MESHFFPPSTYRFEVESIQVIDPILQAGPWEEMWVIVVLVWVIVKRTELLGFPNDQ